MSTIRDGISTVHLSTENIRSAMVNHAGTATRISESINETAVLAAATSRTVHDIGGATNNAAEQMGGIDKAFAEVRSEETPYELQSLMRIEYAVLCLNKKK